MAIAEDANGNSNSHNSSGGGKTSSDPASQAATMAMHIAAAMNEQSPGGPVKPVRGAGGAGNGSGSGGGGGGGGQGSGGAGLVPGPTIPNAATPAVAPHEPDDDDGPGNDDDSSSSNNNNNNKDNSNSSNSSGRRPVSEAGGDGGGGVGGSNEQDSEKNKILCKQMVHDKAKQHKPQKLESDGDEGQQQQQEQQRKGVNQLQQQQREQERERGRGGDPHNHDTTKEAHDAKDDEVSCPWEKVRKEAAAASMDREPGPAPPPGDKGRGKLAPARAPSGGAGNSSSSSSGGVLSSVSGKTLAAGSSNVVITPLTRVYIEDLLDEVRGSLEGRRGLETKTVGEVRGFGWELGRGELQGEEGFTEFRGTWEFEVEGGW